MDSILLKYLIICARITLGHGTFNVENAFLFAKLRQFKLLMKICEREHLMVIKFILCVIFFFPC
jgi:hypothetical protein